MVGIRIKEMDRGIMKRFYVTYAALTSSVKVADLMRLVETTNVRFTIENDKIHQIIVVEAENVPQDAPLCNVFWEEL